MHPLDPQLIERGPLPYLLGDAGAAPYGGTRPVLVFLHGYGEGPPAEIRRALRLHGPLRGDAPEVVREFLVVAPQLPASGDLWRASGKAVREIVRQVQQAHGGDPERTYLTGFSFGANGVFDLALAQEDDSGEPGLWAALWAVDPTRVPAADPGRPVWLSFGNLARVNRDELLRRLRLSEAGEAPDGDRVYTDRGENHVESATSAYGEERVYRWLLSHRRPAHR